MEIIYSIPSPYSMGDKTIEVYGEPEMACYEWRLVAGGHIERDTKNQGYGSAEIALRDALIAASSKESTIAVGDKIDSDGVKTRLCQMRDELTNCGFQTTIFWRAPGQAKSPVAYILAGESFADIEQARKNLIS